MNRRELITAGVAAAVAAPAAAQSWTIQCTPTNCTTLQSSPLAVPQETNVYGTPRNPTAEENAQQYALCQERGHTPTVWGNLHGTNVVTTQFVVIQDRAASTYPNVGASEWQTCWHCKTRYRFVTTMEEEKQ